MAESNQEISYYALLGLHPSASPQAIRRAYREKSKLYHPDTTELSPAIATEKFQQLNEAYATLSSPERRVAYDMKKGYSRVSVIQAPADLNRSVRDTRRAKSSAYLEPTDRPLSAGEVFALFILGITFVGCLLLVIAIGLTRGETAFQVIQLPLDQSSEVVITEPESPSLQVDGATSPAFEDGGSGLGLEPAQQEWPEHSPTFPTQVLPSHPLDADNVESSST